MRSSGSASGLGVCNSDPLLYYITDRRQLAGRQSLLSCIRRAVSRGVQLIQIREKDLPDREILDLACRAVAIAQETSSRIIVNGRADLAIAAGAHGVHLPSGGLTASDLRPWVPRNFLVGVSTHSLRESICAWRSGADYVLLGHIFPTPSKAAYGRPLGLEVLREVCAKVGIPVLGLGGITPERVASVLDAGAAGIAGIRLFQEKNRSEPRP